MSDNDNDLGAFLSGFIIGGLVGAAVALLMAPQSGEETRTIIRERGIELKDKAVETAEDARARAEAAAADARARAEELNEQTRKRADEWKKRGQTLYEEQKGRIGAAIEAGKEAAQRKRTEPGSETPGETPAA